VYADDSERGMLLVIRLERTAILGPPGLLHRAGAARYIQLGKRCFSCSELCSPELPSQRRAAFTFDEHTAHSSIFPVRSRVKYLHNPPSTTHGVIAHSKAATPPAAMSDAGHDAAISDNEVDDVATPAANEEVEAPRDTVEEDGLDDDEDDLFGDGGDDAEEPA
jgi:hypothetical protein